MDRGQQPAARPVRNLRTALCRLQLIPMPKRLKRLVIKVGTSTLTDSSGRLDRQYIASLTSQIADLRSKGCEVVLVTSGSIRAGMERLDLPHRPRTIPEKQAAAAIGQGLLMQMYADLFAGRDITVAQVLLTKADFGDRQRYLNVRNCMLTLLRHGAIPIANENDTVAVDEIRVGDNDNLAALVASALQARWLVILSDIPGLCDADPGKCDTAKVIPVVEKITPDIFALAGGTHGLSGTGGMRTKIEAAEVAVNSGVTMFIADGRRPNVLADVVAGKPVGTKFLPVEDSLRSRKRWIAFGAAPRGSISVNDGARDQLCKGGRSLLAPGIVAVSGSFSGGDLVKVLDQGGNQFARGLVNYGAGEIEKIKGRQSSDIEAVLGYKDFDEVIHCDNLVLGV